MSDIILLVVWGLGICGQMQNAKCKMYSMHAILCSVEREEGEIKGSIVTG